MNDTIKQSSFSSTVLKLIQDSKVSFGDIAEARRFLHAVVYPNNEEVTFLAQMFAAFRLNRNLEDTIGSKLRSAQNMESFEVVQWVLDEVKINSGKSTR